MKFRITSTEALRWYSRLWASAPPLYGWEICHSNILPKYPQLSVECGDMPELIFLVCQLYFWWCYIFFLIKVWETKHTSFLVFELNLNSVLFHSVLYWLKYIPESFYLNSTTTTLILASNSSCLSALILNSLHSKHNIVISYLSKKVFRKHSSWQSISCQNIFCIFLFLLKFSGLEILF